MNLADATCKNDNTWKQSLTLEINGKTILIVIQHQARVTFDSSQLAYCCNVSPAINGISLSLANKVM